jgi:hypothetical protein
LKHLAVLVAVLGRCQEEPLELIVTQVPPRLAPIGRRFVLKYRSTASALNVVRTKLSTSSRV